MTMNLLLFIGWLLITWLAPGLKPADWSSAEWTLVGAIFAAALNLSLQVNDLKGQVEKLTKEVEWQRVALGKYLK